MFKGIFAVFAFVITTLVLSIFANPASAESLSTSVPSIVTQLSDRIHQTDIALQDKSLDHRKQVTCIAMAIYFESRGESLQGQRAVASVVMNRVRDPRFPKTPCEVIYQRGQFTFVKRVLNPGGPLWQQALSIAGEYYTRDRGDIPQLYFTASRTMHGYRIGRHVFH